MRVWVPVALLVSAGREGKRKTRDSRAGGRRPPSKHRPPPGTDYSFPLLDTCNKTLKDKLQIFQNRATTVIAEVGYETESTDRRRSYRRQIERGAQIFMYSFRALLIYLKKILFITKMKEIFYFTRIGRIPNCEQF